MMIAVSKNKFIVLLYLKHLDGRDEHRLEVLDITVNINGRLYIFLFFLLETNIPMKNESTVCSFVCSGSKCSHLHQFYCENPPLSSGSGEMP